MVRKRGGIGALGSSQASSFHPSAKIREKWPNKHKRLRLERLVVTGEEMFRISGKDEVTYKCCIPEVDDGIEFHICANNFWVEQYLARPFEDKLVATARAHPCAPEPNNNQEARKSN